MSEDERQENLASEQLVGALIKNAKEGTDEAWDEVDRLAPQVAWGEHDPLVVMRLLWTKAEDEDENVRDAVMTAWSFIQPGVGLKGMHLGRAMKVMREDNHECAAIWAAVTVGQYASDSRLGEKATEAMSDFRARIARMDEEEGRGDWRETRDDVLEKVGDRVFGLAGLLKEDE
jgi:hypothetical protein